MAKNINDQRESWIDNYSVVREKKCFTLKFIPCFTKQVEKKERGGVSICALALDGLAGNRDKDK